MVHAGQCPSYLSYQQRIVLDGKYLTCKYKPKYPKVNSTNTSTSIFRVQVQEQVPITTSLKGVNEIHQYCTRASNNYHLESVNTNIKQFSIKYECPILRTSLPASIWSLNNVNQFKRHIIDTLLEKYLY